MKSKFAVILAVLVVVSMLVTPAFAQTPAPAAGTPAAAPDITKNPYYPADLFKLADALKAATAGKTAPAGAKYAFMVNVVAPFWNAAKAGIQRASKEFNVPVDFYAPTGNNTAERITQQNTNIETFVNNKYTGITFSADDQTAPKAVIQKAVDAGIPVICMDSDAVGTARELYVGMSDLDAGMQAGKAALEIVKSGKMVAQFGDETSANGQGRLAGFKAAISGTAISLVETLYDAAVPEKALSNAQAAMQKYSDLAGFLGIWSINGPQQYQAVKQAGKVGQIKIIAWDTEPDTQRGMAEGAIQVMIAQRAFFYGYLPAWIMYAQQVLGKDAVWKIMDPYLLDKGAEKKVHLNTGVDIVKSDTFQLYKDYLQAIGIASQ
jgi:ribose transport system substrate-binding protein